MVAGSPAKLFPDEFRLRCLQALHRPQPRLELIEFLRCFASSAIDVSDGLQGDLAHILKASHCGARIDQAALPVAPWIEQHNLYHYALGAGDDYEICCSLPQEYRAEVENWNRQQADCCLTVIGELTATGVRPFFSKKLQVAGFKLDPELFTSRKSSMW